MTQKDPILILILIRNTGSDRHNPFCRKIFLRLKAEPNLAISGFIGHPA